MPWTVEYSIFSDEVKIIESWFILCGRADNRERYRYNFLSSLWKCPWKSRPLFLGIWRQKESKNGENVWIATGKLLAWNSPRVGSFVYRTDRSEPDLRNQDRRLSKQVAEAKHVVHNGAKRDTISAHSLPSRIIPVKLVQDANPEFKTFDPSLDMQYCNPPWHKKFLQANSRVWSSTCGNFYHPPWQYL